MEQFFAAHLATIQAISAIGTAAAALLAAAGLAIANRHFSTVLRARLSSGRLLAPNTLLSSESELHDNLFITVSNRSTFPVYLSHTALTAGHWFSRRGFVVVAEQPFFAEGGRTLQPFTQHSIQWMTTERLLERVRPLSLPARLTLTFKIDVPGDAPKPVKMSKAVRQAIIHKRRDL